MASLEEGETLEPAVKQAEPRLLVKPLRPTVPEEAQPAACSDERVTANRGGPASISAPESGAFPKSHVRVSHVSPNPQQSLFPESRMRSFAFLYERHCHSRTCC